jgi:hypothetical protein
MEKLKANLSLDTVEALHDYLESFLLKQAKEDDDKLLFACLAEVKRLLYIKLAKMQKEYLCSFTPAQALALRILSTNYVQEYTSFLGNKLHQIANKVNQQYI